MIIMIFYNYSKYSEMIFCTRFRVFVLAYFLFLPLVASGTETGLKNEHYAKTVIVMMTHIIT